MIFPRNVAFPIDRVELSLLSLTEELQADCRTARQQDSGVLAEVQIAGRTDITYLTLRLSLLEDLFTSPYLCSLYLLSFSRAGGQGFELHRWHIPKACEISFSPNSGLYSVGNTTTVLSSILHLTLLFHIDSPSHSQQLQRSLAPQYFFQVRLSSGYCRLGADPAACHCAPLHPWLESHTLTSHVLQQQKHIIHFDPREHSHSSSTMARINIPLDALTSRLK